MSWSYSPELVAAFLEANCSGTEQLQPSNMTPTPDQFYWPDKPMEHSRISRFGMTCEPLTGNRGAELLMWYLEGFPVKTYQSPEKAQDLTESDQDCGEKWRGWSAKYDPVTSSWKTAQLSLLGDLELSSVIFPRSGMTRNGLLWELPMLERPTNETGCGFSPDGDTFFHTPNTRGLDGGSNSRKALQKRQWPTPVASDTSSRSKPYAQGGTPLSLAVKLWPTPTVCWNYNRKGASATSGDGLATAVRMWPTPTAHNAKETNAPSESARNTPTLASQAGGPLNPDWVEWLMGWPIGHTALKPSETDKCRNVEQQHGNTLVDLEETA